MLLFVVYWRVEKKILPKIFSGNTKAKSKEINKNN